MDDQQERFLRAVYEERSTRGDSYFAEIESIAENLGIDPVANMEDRHLYRDVMLSLENGGYLDCQANKYGVPCAIVRITERGLAPFES